MKALVAGIGNIFFGDDAYGSEVARMLANEPLPPGAKVTDYGIRGMHAAFEMLEGYDLVIFIDAAPRGSAPGTIHVLDGLLENGGRAVPDAHSMELHNVLAFYERLARDLSPARRPRIVIIGCEPECTGEGIGLSAAVAAAVPETLPVVRRLLAEAQTGAQTYEAT